MVKIKFCDVPLMVPYPFSDRYCLQRDMECTWIADNGLEKSIVVPEGFITDGASIPKFLWEEIGSPYQPKFITAAIVHDWFCENDWEVDEMSEVFYELLLDSDVGSVKAALMYKSVDWYKTLF